MMLDGHLVVPTVALKGFDCNEQLDAPKCKKLFDAGLRFAIRYVRRDEAHKYDLSMAEASVILSSGLGLMAVQHVESETAWEPTSSKGYAYGQNAAEHAKAIGLPPGSMLWLDLEAVKSGTSATTTLDYCNTWHCQVAAAGFLPGLYVGDHCGLSADDLYSHLRFTHYWSAYNLNTDRYPAIRGVQLKQHESDPIAGVRLQVDTLQKDRLGSTPQLLTRWAA